MGIESDQLVYDYLSRVGDLAQRAMPSAQRMQLVAQLREDIDRQRSRHSDHPAAVRRILGRIGSPDAVVERAAGAPPARPAPTSPIPPTSPASPASNERAAGAREGVTAPVPAPRDGGVDADPDWWRTEGADRERRLGEDGVPSAFRFVPDEAFFDGIEGEDPAKRAAGGAGEPEETEGTKDAGGYGEAESEAAPEPVRRRWWRRRAPVPAVEPEAVAPRRRAFGWRELGSAALLIGGTVMGSWIAVLGGWVLAYYSLRLTRTETRIAAVGIPLAAAGAVAVWLWGRADGRWGEALPGGKAGPVLEDAAPVAVRVAALASAVFVVWRADRRSRR